MSKQASGDIQQRGRGGGGREEHVMMWPRTINDPKKGPFISDKGQEKKQVRKEVRERGDKQSKRVTCN